VIVTKNITTISNDIILLPYSNNIYSIKQCRTTQSAVTVAILGGGYGGYNLSPQMQKLAPQKQRWSIHYTQKGYS